MADDGKKDDELNRRFGELVRTVDAILLRLLNTEIWSSAANSGVTKMRNDMDREHQQIFEQLMLLEQKLDKMIESFPK